MKIAIVFPGYGSQTLGMGKSLYDDERLMQEYFEEASACLNRNFVKLCFASSQEQLAQITNAYPSLLLLGYATYRVLLQEGVTPQLVAGENIGSFTAFACAGAMSFPDALFIINQYAQLYEQFLDDADVAMISIVGGDHKKIESLCKKASSEEFTAQIAVYRADLSVLVSGSAPAIDALKKMLDEDDDLSYQDEDCGHELHCALMQPVVDQLLPQLNLIDIKKSIVPVVRATDGALVSERQDIVQTLIDRIVQPIHLDYMVKAVSGFDLIIQVGPGDELAQLLAKKYPKKWVFSVNQRSDINEIKKYLQTKIEPKDI